MITPEDIVSIVTKDTKTYRDLVTKYVETRKSYEDNKRVIDECQDKVIKYSLAINDCRNADGIDSNTFNTLTEMYEETKVLLSMPKSMATTNNYYKESDLQKYAEILKKDYGIEDLDKLYEENRCNTFC